MEKRESYEKPIIEVIEFVIEDSIAASGNGALDDEWMYGGN
jgi:hypothetical protein